MRLLINFNFITIKIYLLSTKKGNIFSNMLKHYFHNHPEKEQYMRSLVVNTNFILFFD